MLHYTFLTSLSYLILFTSTYAPSSAFAVPPRSSFLLDRFTKQSHIHKRPWTLLRDHIISRIWSLPQSWDTKTCGHDQLSKPSNPAREGPPAALLARYGGDVLLRFNISNAEEAEALAEATNVLFLDIWEFTSEWADIRLAKDMVQWSSTKFRNPKEANADGYEGPVLARPASSVARARPYAVDSRSRSSNPRVLS